ncbi:hypothetical protein DFH06DRAFT_1337472 [Mycena polygramma]|nr:hypothetical protein DFH06DRAFT_1337472 [Mycena polygramma]
MSVDDLSRATASLNINSRSSLCEPRFILLPRDPSVAVLSSLANRKFYVVKKGAPGSEAIYSHWDLAKVHVLGVSGAEHESCSTEDRARAIWAEYCQANHHHPPPRPPPRSPSGLVTQGRPPPPYSPMTPPSSPRVRLPDHTPTRTPTRSRPTPAPEPRTPEKFYRVTGSPRVLINAADAEAELRASANTGLLVGASLSDVEDDDEVTPVGAVHFYRVFGSHRVLNSREAAITELVASNAAGLFVGDTLAAVVE